MFARRFKFVLLVLLLCGVAAGLMWRCSWSSSAIAARVVDSESQKPLAGAIVVANWEVKGLEGYVEKQLAIAEVRTDSTGRFEIPSWGPRFHFGIGVVRGDQPVIRFFHPNYVPIILQNVPTPGTRELERVRMRIHPSLDGDTISLTPFSGAPNEHAAMLEPLRRSLEFAYAGAHCEWLHTPQMFAALERLAYELEAAGVDGPIFRLEFLGGQERCGNARRAIEGAIQ